MTFSKDSNTTILAENINIGINTVIEPTAKIRGLKGKAKKISIGDNCYIGHNVQIIIDDFQIGDYSTIHHDTNIHGYRPCCIGHNAWIGQFSIIDSIGGVSIGNNCGIGAHSQLWSHIKYGDTLEGCRFFSESLLKIGDDVWFVGHCIVSPITAEDKSMAMAGSVITNDMKYNTVYAGVPAKSISEKIGAQFVNKSINKKLKLLQKHLLDSGIKDDFIKIVINEADIYNDPNVTFFNVANRKYTKKSLPDEILFMKFLLPEKAKFIPYE